MFAPPRFLRCVFAFALGVALSRATAQECCDPPPISFPAHRPLTIGVFGDSMGDGLWWGLSQEIKGGKDFQFARFSKASTGLARYDAFNVEARAAVQIAARPIDAAIILIGANDQQDIIQGRTYLGFNTPAWRTIYFARIDSLVALLRKSGAAVYWVGLPKMRKPRFDRGVQALNAIFAERMAALGVPLIATVPVTADENGAYLSHFASGGKIRLLRARDGVHMTMAGYVRLAAPVAARLRADLAASSVTTAAE